MWAGWSCFLGAARDVIGLRLPEHKVFKFYETAAAEGGFRVMHEEFCMVSDFPKTILMDSENRPHCDDGPSHEWRDGWKLWHIHGVRIPFEKRHIVEHPETITCAEIDAEENAEIRRVMIDRFGADRYLKETNSVVVDSASETHPVVGIRTARLLRKDVADDEPIIMLDMLNSTPEPDGTTKRYMIRIDPNAYGGKAGKDCVAAMASTYRYADGSMLFKTPADYAPEFES